MEIKRLACKYYNHNTTEIWHFTALPLGQAEYSFVSSDEWWCKEAEVPVPKPCLAINCIWTITSPPPTYLMTWPRNEFPVVALSDPTGRAFHRT